ncbi:DUF6366 family protein [Salimicrobium sp. PL1-032A]|uniref:DUF6366 family protein n=1 Tax=Salimicrobium sp. PL1-032A TaxID=3095364 RepID=UPI00326082FA
MGDEKETPEKRRERLRQEELKRNPTSNLNDSSHRAHHGSLVDLVGGMGWKGTGALLILIAVGFLIFLLFFR